MIAAEVRVRLKKGVADPEGANTKKALELLGFTEVNGVRTSKCFTILLETDDEGRARKRVEEMCQGLLANPVIQSYDITLSRED
jgi:phosphoribosylformylglycinamidine synthase PurS subunit